MRFNLLIPLLCLATTLPIFAGFDLATGSHTVSVNGSITGLHETLNPQPPLTYDLSLNTTQFDTEVGEANFPWPDWSWSEGNVDDAVAKAETKVKSANLVATPGDSAGHAGANGNSMAMTSGNGTVKIAYGIEAPGTFAVEQSRSANGSKSVTDVLTNTFTCTLSQYRVQGIANQWRIVLRIGNVNYAPIWGRLSTTLAGAIR